MDFFSSPNKEKIYQSKWTIILENTWTFSSAIRLTIPVCEERLFEHIKHCNWTLGKTIERYVHRMCENDWRLVYDISIDCYNWLMYVTAIASTFDVSWNSLEWTERISYFRNFTLQIFDAAPKSQMFSKCTALSDKRSESCFTFEYLK